MGNEKQQAVLEKEKDHKDKLAKTHKQWNVLLCDGRLSETLEWTTEEHSRGRTA